MHWLDNPMKFDKSHGVLNNLDYYKEETAALHLQTFDQCAQPTLLYFHPIKRMQKKGGALKTTWCQTPQPLCYVWPKYLKHKKIYSNLFQGFHLEPTQGGSKIVIIELSPVNHGFNLTC